jgi:hypothetical protein
MVSSALIVRSTLSLPSAAASRALAASDVTSSASLEMDVVASVTAVVMAAPLCAVDAVCSEASETSDQVAGRSSAGG